MDWNKNSSLNNTVKKIDQSIKLKDFPHISGNGEWITTEDGYWTGGFWVGLLWFSYKITSKDAYKRETYKLLERLKNRRTDKTFDLGFLFYPSFALGYELTGDGYLRDIALEAADTLATFFHTKTGFVYNNFAINSKKIGRTIIDVMMNLHLLWWAYEETAEEKFYNIAYTHSKRTIEEFIREDYSTIHVIDFDLETGEILGKITGQGYGDESCWSRGQAWAIYGFTLAYKTSKDKQFLKIAENLADYFMANLPEDYVPYWDFNDPTNPNAVKDSSAAAIACSGLLTLSEFSGREDFREISVSILNSLCNNYLVEEGKNGILKHGCYHKPENIGADESLIWGDYYFIEALMKVERKMG